MRKLLFVLSLSAMTFLPACQNFSPLHPPETLSDDAALLNEFAAMNKNGPQGGAIVVLTHNVYVGTDVDYVIAAPTPADVPVRAAEAFQGLLATDFYERADAFAKEIRRARPHLIGLQEISTIRIQSPGDAVVGGTIPAEDVLFDYLDILMDALQAHHLKYKVAGVIENTDVEVPMIVSADPLQFDDIRLTDYDVVLVRKDVKIANVFTKNYIAKFTVPSLGAEIIRGFVAVDAKVNGRIVRFVNTHLEPAPIPDLLPVQMGQAQELAAIMAAETKPVIVVGDLNSSAPDGPTYQFFLDNGYLDMWTEKSNPGGGDGNTSSHDLDLRNPVPNLTKRIDYILLKNDPAISGLSLRSACAVVVGDELGDRTVSGMWPSDHAGVVAAMRLSKAQN